jgi:hypothetical protein
VLYAIESAKVDSTGGFERVWNAGSARARDAMIDRKSPQVCENRVFAHSILLGNLTREIRRVSFKLSNVYEPRANSRTDGTHAPRSSGVITIYRRRLVCRVRYEVQEMFRMRTVFKCCASGRILGVELGGWLL